MVGIDQARRKHLAQFVSIAHMVAHACGGHLEGEQRPAVVEASRHAGVALVLAFAGADHAAMVVGSERRSVGFAAEREQPEGIELDGMLLAAGRKGNGFVGGENLMLGVKQATVSEALGQHGGPCGGLGIRKAELPSQPHRFAQGVFGGEKGAKVVFGVGPAKLVLPHRRRDHDGMRAVGFALQAGEKETRAFAHHRPRHGQCPGGVV